MTNIGDKFIVIIHDFYIVIVEYIGINEKSILFKYGKPLFKIIDFINRKPHIYNLEVGGITDDNIYYKNKDFIFSLKNKQKEIIFMIFEF